jgi:hypothetical protein
VKKPKRRTPAVVDTNVPIVANHKYGEPLMCSAACARALYEITKQGVLVIDARGLIFDEYKKYLSFSGQPGAGDSFFKWLADNRYAPDRVAQVVLVDDPVREREFAAFPDTPDLATFDRSDRKFVAVALTHPGRPSILNAVDGDWIDHEEALEHFHTFCRL